MGQAQSRDGAEALRHELMHVVRIRYPPAIAPMIINGSAPDAMASGSGASGDSKEQSSEHAKKRRKARRLYVTWSRIVPCSTG